MPATLNMSSHTTPFHVLLLSGGNTSRDPQHEEFKRRDDYLAHRFDFLKKKATTINNHEDDLNTVNHLSIPVTFPTATPNSRAGRLSPYVDLLSVPTPSSRPDVGILSDPIRVPSRFPGSQAPLARA